MRFSAFFIEWAEVKGWQVPDFHILICEWLEDRGQTAVLQVFRGASKSTITAVYEAWKLYESRDHRFLVQAADDNLAKKMTRDARDVLRRHPRCAGMLSGKPAEHMFWVDGASDSRNASVTASGVLSNVTGSRADEAIFDDVEVPKNVQTPDLREKLRSRISDATYILVPGGRKLYIGTPHCHDSLYQELETKGADTLKIPLFLGTQRIEDADKLEMVELSQGMRPEELYVFHGDRLLSEGVEYELEGRTVVFTKRLSGLVDMYSGCVWPERFTREEIGYRRKEAHSLNEWDSQYLLRAKPLTDSRLNPDKLVWYDCEPEFTMRNGVLVMTLGSVRITSMRAYWDVALGKKDGDGSVLSVVLGDDGGNLYWHSIDVLDGELDAQCLQVAATVKRLKIPNVQIETNGVGGFVPAIARKHLKVLGCSVTEVHQSKQKADRILGAFEPALSSGILWAHVSTAQTGMPTQMRDFNPDVKDQPDDILDSGAGAILGTPVKISSKAQAQATAWRPHGQTYEATRD